MTPSFTVYDKWLHHDYITVSNFCIIKSSVCIHFSLHNQVNSSGVFFFRIYFCYIDSQIYIAVFTEADSKSMADISCKGVFLPLWENSSNLSLSKNFLTLLRKREKTRPPAPKKKKARGKSIKCTPVISLSTERRIKRQTPSLD